MQFFRTIPRAHSKTLTHNTLWRIFTVIIVLAFLPTQYIPLVAAADGLSPEQKLLYRQGINYFDINGNCSTTGDTQTASAAETTGQVDISSVVSKYGLQSVMIKELGGSTIASYKPTEPPNTPASTMKLIIADTVLQDGENLAQTVHVTSDVLYDGGNDLGTSSLSLEAALKATLSVSSNVGANVLMKSLGGVDSFTQKANSYGYNDTKVKGYYDPSNDGKNSSTIGDEVSAMNHLFSSNGAGYTVAQNALETAARNDNHYSVDDDANKWAGTTTVAGNVGKFKVGGKDYIIGLYYNGNMNSDAAKDAIKNGSADLVKAVQTNGSTAPAAPTTGSTACCASGSDAGDGDTSGSGGDSGSWNSGLSAPYILEQWATEVLKDLAQKKGTSATDAVTKEHVTALVAFAMGEGGDINNSDLFNPLNSGIDAPDLVDGNHDTSGVQSFKSFDAGVEAAARSFAKPQYSRLATALLKSDSTAKQFMYALSYNWQKPGGAIWAEASTNEPSYYQGRLNLIRQVGANYKGTAGLVIGTPEKELINNTTETSKLTFDGNGLATTDTTDNGGSCAGGAASADAAGIAQEAISLSWPDDSHGITPTDAYKAAYQQYNPHGPGIADCGGFVATVMHAAGADTDYPPGGTSIQEAYVRAHPEKYDVADSVSSIDDLQPGDIMIVNHGSGANGEGHTYIYVGPQQPHNLDEASASQGTRAANLGKAVLSDSRGNYLRARLK